MESEGLLLVVSGPSGTGKGTICRTLMGRKPHISYSVSATTRAPREGEVDGVHYHFVTKEKFKSMIEKDELFEWAQVYGNYYGTPKEKVQNSLDSGKDIILEIDVQGALQIKEVFPNGVFLYIVPPSLEILKERIINRGTDTEEVIKDRLACVDKELTYIGKYDYVIVNDNLEDAVNKMDAIVVAEKCRPHRCKYEVK